MQQQKNTDPSQNEALIVELLQMGFNLEKIEIALKLTQDKQKLIEHLVTCQQISQTKEEYDLPKESQNQGKILNEKDEESADFEDEEEVYKMVFLARMDLKLPLSALAAQVATAALGAFKQLEAQIEVDELSEVAYYEWLESGQRKIVVKVPTYEDFCILIHKIKTNNIDVYESRISKYDQIPDIPQGTITVAAIGPAPEQVLDKLTRHLKLL